MKKPVVLFPYVEAGMGHIVPMKAICEKFEEMYGGLTDCREVRFFADSGKDVLKKFEKKMCLSVINSDKKPSLGFFMTFNMNFWGTKIATAASARFLQRGAYKSAVERMDGLSPDLVVSTHWSTNYFAKKSAAKPLTALFCPDAKLYPLFNYPCDMALIPTMAGYEEALKKFPERYDKSNLKYVGSPISESALNVVRNKREMRKKLGLNPEKFTVLLAEGGYGIGKMTEICRKVLERDPAVTLIPVCGKNESLYGNISKWQSGKNCELKPVGFTDKMPEYMVAADLLCGKSGANVYAEACFFGLPQMVTNYASGVEKLNGEYYVKQAKTAIKVFNADAAAGKIEEFANDPQKITPLRLAAEAQRANFGAAKAAEEIFALLCTRYPELKAD